MRKLTKTQKLLFAAAILIVAGIIISVIGTVLGGRPGYYIDDTGIHTYAEKDKNQSAHTLEKTKLDSFQNIELKVEYADINIIPSDGYYLEYQTEGGAKKPAYSVSNNTLKFSESQDHDTLFFSFFWDSFPIASNQSELYINLYVPTDAVFGLIDIANGDGDVTADQITADTFKCIADYGVVSLKSLTAAKAEISIDDGELSFDTIQSDKITLSNDYGDIDGGNLSGKAIAVNSEDGNLKFNNLQTERLDLSNDYGNVNIDTLSVSDAKITLEDGDFQASLGEIKALDMTNSYGDIRLKLPEKLDAYATDLTTEYGNIELSGNENVRSLDDEAVYKNNSGQSKRITIYCEDGNINLNY